MGKIGVYILTKLQHVVVSLSPTFSAKCGNSQKKGPLALAISVVDPGLREDRRLGRLG